MPARPIQQQLSNCFYLLGNYLNSKSAMFDPNEEQRSTLQSHVLATDNQKLVIALNQVCTALLRALEILCHWDKLG